ncbi:Protoheme IX farnesyltransferase [subsurface metagenome]
MVTNEVRSFLKLIRFDYSIYSACGVLLAGWIAGDLTGIQSEYLITFLIVFFAAVGLYSLNDYFDFEVDKKNKRNDRPLVLGGLTRKTALRTGIIFLSMTLLLTLFLNIPAKVLIYSSLPLFFVYNMWLKKFFVFKNILVAYGYFVTIILGSIVSDEYIEPLIIYFAIMGFIVGFALEIMLDIGDVIGDKSGCIETFATRWGTKIAAQLVIILYVVIMILDPIPYLVEIDTRLFRDDLFLILITIPIISYALISKSLLTDQSLKNVNRLKKRIIVTMQTGSIAYLIGVII